MRFAVIVIIPLDRLPLALVERFKLNHECPNYASINGKPNSNLRQPKSDVKDISGFIRHDLSSPLR
jgi:hypothetical protein